MLANFSRIVRLEVPEVKVIWVFFARVEIGAVALDVPLGDVDVVDDRGEVGARVLLVVHMQTLQLLVKVDLCSR